MSVTKNLKLLCIYPTTYEDLKQKDVLHLTLEKDEFGFFSKVFHVFYPAPLTREIQLNSVHTIIELSRKFTFLFRLGHGCSKLGVLLNLVIYILRVLAVAVTGNVDIIRAQTAYFEGLCALIISKVLGIPFCVSIHSDYDKCYQVAGIQGAPVFLGSRELAKKLERFVLSHCEMVMPIRESLAECAIRNGAKPETIRLIPHGIDMRYFLKEPGPDFKKYMGIPSEKKVISFVGRLSKENYIYDFIKIAKNVKRVRNDVIFVIIGGGPEENNFTEEIKNNNLKEMFKLFGFQQRANVAEFRLNSDICLCLMGGYSLIESAAAGKPLIAYDIDWHSELVKNNETGFLVKEGDIEEVTKSILMLIDNEQLRLKLGKNAQELAIQKHSLEFTSAIKVKYYRELLDLTV